MIRAAEETTSLLESVWGGALMILMIVLVASGLHLLVRVATARAVRRWIKSGRSRESSLTARPEETVELQALIMSQRREQRARAIGQLLRNSLALMIWATAMLLILTELGVNIAPLLASAGVVGVALGFGAQTLVKDYLSGFFMIAEDQYGVGDLVDLGPVVGTVEEVTLRITRVRDPSGVVWYVRNGEILRVANQSQGWTMAAAVIAVSYDADLRQVRRIVHKIGDEMWEDPETRTMMLSRPTFAGVDSVTGDAVFIRVIAKARASYQMGLTRDMRERLKVALDAAGIKVPALARQVQFGPDGNPLPPGTLPPAPAAR